MRLLTFFAALFLLFARCSEPQNAIKDNEPMSISRLTSDMIFSGDIVKNFKVVNDSTATKANQLFLHGIDEFRNKNNPKGAVDLFIQSICLNPLAQSYYEMGNACMSANELNQALDSYEMAGKLGYEPFSKILYNYACIYSRKKDYNKSSDYLEATLQAGYSNLNQIRRDPDLAGLREESEWQFNYALHEGLKGMSNPDQLFWLQFLKGFAKVKDNFAIDGITQQFKDQDQVSFDYETYVSEMRGARYSREVDRLFYGVAEINTGSDIVAIVYAEADAFSEHPFYIYHLATYTGDGKVIDKRVIAGREDLNQVKTAKFSKGGNVSVSTYDLTYEKDLDSEGYEDNPIKSKELVETQDFTISGYGKILSYVTAAAE